MSDYTEKLIEGLKSPEAPLMLPDLLSMADPFGSSVEDTRDGKWEEHKYIIYIAGQK